MQLQASVVVSVFKEISIPELMHCDNKVIEDMKKLLRASLRGRYVRNS
jgi:hypothetical protein